MQALQKDDWHLDVHRQWWKENKEGERKQKEQLTGSSMGMCDNPLIQGVSSYSNVSSSSC